MTVMRYEGNFALEVDADMPAVWARAAEPDFPYRNHNGTSLTPGQAIEHLAWNALANGVTDLSDLDGYADWERGTATMRVRTVEVDL